MHSSPVPTPIAAPLHAALKVRDVSARRRCVGTLYRLPFPWAGRRWRRSFDFGPGGSFPPFLPFGHRGLSLCFRGALAHHFPGFSRVYIAGGPQAKGLKRMLWNRAHYGLRMSFATAALSPYKKKRVRVQYLRRELCNCGFCGKYRKAAKEVDGRCRRCHATLYGAYQGLASPNLIKLFKSISSTGPELLDLCVHVQVGMTCRSKVSMVRNRPEPIRRIQTRGSSDRARYRQAQEGGRKHVCNNLPISML